MNKYTVIFTADLHGNEGQFKKLFDYAKGVDADSIIIGGDIAPKDQREQYIQTQRDFLDKRLPAIIKDFKEDSPKTRVFMMLGNDDCASNRDVFEKKSAGLYEPIHGRRLSITPDLDIIGYGIVPITPFSIKDWEKYDFSDPPSESANAYANRKASNYNLKGRKSTKKGWVFYDILPETEKKYSIQKDLEKPIFLRRPEKTIYVMHAPPDNTSLDKIIINAYGKMMGMSVGSMAIRDFTERKQPYLTLHGHIHESVDITMSFKEKIGKTLCMGVGNYNDRTGLAVLVFDIHNLESAERIII
jgi:uncharacterized protein